MDDDPGTVVVGVPVPAPADDAWGAITRGDRLAWWFGDLSIAELAPGARARLEFGDGDFFDVDVCDVDPAARRVHWRWRFLGCGVREDIVLAVAPNDASSAVVTVSDSEPRRSREASLALGEGWRDFLSRLERHLATQARTRYAWRSEVDVWTELPASADDASRTLIPAAAAWLPFDHGESLFAADAILLGDEPGDRLAIADVEPAGPRAVRFHARPAGMGGVTCCEISIQPLGDQAVLGINHVGFGELDASDERRRRLRESCLRAWLRAVRRAAEILESQQAFSGATSAAARDAA